MAEKILMYMHAGSGNHGCEAIVNGMCHILKEPQDSFEITVLTNDKPEDEKYSLGKLCTLVQEKKMQEHFLTHVLYYLYRKVTGNEECFLSYRYKNAAPFSDYDVAVSIGGDNYCYDMMVKDLVTANRMFEKEGIKTVLLGCSIEPDVLKNKTVVEDMKRYALIVSRESLTTKALKDAGVEQVVQLPDPAFYLEPALRELPKGFVEGNTVGINVSPMIMDFENEEKAGVVWNNYVSLIRYILAETDMQIALIPHVVWDRNDDMRPIRKLKELFPEERVVLIEDGTCEELKGDIARCRFFVGARTHSTIAAYSTCVPTLVAGYSVKSLGIAADLFGSTEGYVVDVRKMTEENELTDAFVSMMQREEEMRTILQKRIPEYKEKLTEMRTIFAEV